MSRVESLNNQKKALTEKLDQCWCMKEYTKLKNSIMLIDQEIEIETKGFDTYSLVKKINERISDLEYKKYKALMEKKTCDDIGRYRRLVDIINVLDKTIEVNKGLIASESSR